MLHMNDSEPSLKLSTESDSTQHQKHGPQNKNLHRPPLDKTQHHQTENKNQHHQTENKNQDHQTENKNQHHQTENKTQHHWSGNKKSTSLCKRVSKTNCEPQLAHKPETRNPTHKAVQKTDHKLRPLCGPSFEVQNVAFPAVSPKVWPFSGRKFWPTGVRPDSWASPLLAKIGGQKTAAKK